MNTNQITKELKESHLKFIKYIDKLSKEDYNFSYQNKWNANQHFDHIYKSVAITAKAFGYPKWLLKYKFGKANRPSRTKEELEKRYNERLLETKGKPTPSRFHPINIDFKDKEKAFKKLISQVDKLNKCALKISDKNLEICIIPHPLLGKLTLTEMLYFTNYHVKHHQELINKYL
jgi:hypothetical protein